MTINWCGCGWLLAPPPPCCPDTCYRIIGLGSPPPRSPPASLDVQRFTRPTIRLNITHSEPSSKVALRELLEKDSDVTFLREMVSFAANRPESADAVIPEAYIQGISTGSVANCARGA